MKWMVLLLSLTSVHAWADSSTGCGLGSLIWKENSIISGIFRITTNHSFSSQLFGITTGTSGCSKHQIVMREKAPLYFAEANLDILKVEMAKGEGEYLEAFAETLGCKEEVREQVKSNMKVNYQFLFPTGSEKPSEMLDHLNKLMERDHLDIKCPYV